MGKCEFSYLYNKSAQIQKDVIFLESVRFTSSCVCSSNKNHIQTCFHEKEDYQRGGLIRLLPFQLSGRCLTRFSQINEQCFQPVFSFWLETFFFPPRKFECIVFFVVAKSNSEAVIAHAPSPSRTPLRLWFRDQHSCSIEVAMIEQGPSG